MWTRVDNTAGEDTMNSQQQHGELQAAASNGAFLRTSYTHEALEEDCEDTLSSPLVLQTGQGSIAYEILLLQQRLAAYEQLHIEEMMELRREIERLRRAFLQETHPDLRSISSVHAHE
jgi:hypothetical protein